MFGRVSSFLATAAAAITVSVGAVSAAVIGGPMVNSSVTSVALADRNNDGVLELEGWSSFTAQDVIGGFTFDFLTNADPSRGVGLVPGLDVRTSPFGAPAGWSAFETYIAGEPVWSSVKGSYVTAIFRNEKPTSAMGATAGYGKYLRLTFYRPEEAGDWVVGGGDGDPRNFVQIGNVTIYGMNNVPLPPAGLMLGSALIGGLFWRRRGTRPVAA